MINEINSGTTKIRILFLVVATLILAGCQTESTKWELAQLELLAESDDSQYSAEQLKDLSSRLTFAPSLQLRIAPILAQTGDADSIKICDQVLQSGWGQKRDHRNDGFEIKSRCQQVLGDFEGALQSYKQALADNVVRSSGQLNGLAYCRALANRELLMAAEDIDKAIKLTESQPWPSNLYLPLPAKTAMAIGMISRHLEPSVQLEAREMINSMIREYDHQYAEIRSLIPETIFSQIQSKFPLEIGDEQDTQLARNRQDIVRNSLVSLLSVRALLDQDAGNMESCNEARYRIKELGFDASDLARQLPSSLHCLDLLGHSMMFLDTRGFIISRLPWDLSGFTKQDLELDRRLRLGSYQEANSNLTLALAAADFMDRGLNEGVFNSPNLTVTETTQLLKTVKHNQAILLYHRMLTHQRSGNRDAAFSDEQRIKALGHEPGDHLF